MDFIHIYHWQQENVWVSCKQWIEYDFYVNISFEISSTLEGWLNMFYIDEKLLTSDKKIKIRIQFNNIV